MHSNTGLFVATKVGMCQSRIRAVETLRSQLPLFSELTFQTDCLEKKNVYEPG